MAAAGAWIREGGVTLARVKSVLIQGVNLEGGHADELMWESGCGREASSRDFCMKWVD